MDVTLLQYLFVNNLKGNPNSSVLIKAEQTSKKKKVLWRIAIIEAYREPIQMQVVPLSFQHLIKINIVIFTCGIASLIILTFIPKSFPGSLQQIPKSETCQISQMSTYLSRLGKVTF